MSGILKRSVLAACLFILMNSSVMAQEKEAGGGDQRDLASAATNPVSNLIQFRLQDLYTSSNYNVDGYSNTSFVQTVVPLSGLADEFDSLKGIVTRTTIGYVSTPDFDGIGRQNGLGDTSILAFAVPKAAPEKTVWGVGPALTLPTAGDNEYTGSGYYQAGPAAVFMVSPTKSIQWGALVFHQEDIGNTGRDNRVDDVSTTFIQPIFNYHFDEGWYVGLPDTPQAYDHEENQWTYNIGGVLGRVTKVGGRPMQIFGGVYYNPEEPDDAPAPEWSVKFQVGWLFPQ